MSKQQLPDRWIHFLEKHPNKSEYQKVRARFYDNPEINTVVHNSFQIELPENYDINNLEFLELI